MRHISCIQPVCLRMCALFHFGFWSTTESNIKEDASKQTCFKFHSFSVWALGTGHLILGRLILTEDTILVCVVKIAFCFLRSIDLVEIKLLKILFGIVESFLKSLPCAHFSLIFFAFVLSYFKKIEYSGRKVNQ